MYLCNMENLTTLEAALYLLPVSISEADPRNVIPEVNIRIVRQIKWLIVENIRTARRFLRKCDPDIDIDAITFFELNRHTDISAISSYLDPLRSGEPMGVMSEAGCPAVADPGALPVAIAQREGLKIVPLSGPSSILMSLMASGFNGQGFSFCGYLPIDEGAKLKRIKELETLSARHGMTQIFIETPYRNNRMLKTLISSLRPDTMLCVAADITHPTQESIRSMKVLKWKGVTENYDKRPAIFLIYAGNGEAIASSHKK